MKIPGPGEGPAYPRSSTRFRGDELYHQTEEPANRHDLLLEARCGEVGYMILGDDPVEHATRCPECYPKAS